MKKCLPPLFGLLSLLALPLTVKAQLLFTTNIDAITIGGNGAITITGYSGSPTNLSIPASINGYPVTSISDGAFEYNYSLISISIPNSVTSIGSFAFENCLYLTNISVAADNPVYSSTNGVLFDKNQTTLLVYPAGRFGSYVVPNSVMSINSYAFEGCSVANVTIPNSVTLIGDGAFLNCGNLYSITIGNNVTSIGDGAFEGCSMLESISIPNSVTSIGSFAFKYCVYLGSISIPESVTSIGDGAFEYCGGMRSFSVDANNPVYSSTNGVLFDKNQTTLLAYPAHLRGSYIIPSSVTSIGNYAFSDCSFMTSVTIPNSVTSIGGYAFEDCEQLGLLASVSIPNSVTSIGDYAFSDCINLSDITFLGNAPSLGGGSVFALGPGSDPGPVYYYYGTSGWGSTYGGLPTVMLGAPPAHIGGGLGVQSSGFSIPVSGVTNQTVVIEASTNLVNWQPVWTNMLTVASAIFTDSSWTNYTARFYRAR